MGIDVDRLLGAEPLSWDASWDEREVVLHHLGIGAGVPPTDPVEVGWAAEPVSGGVLPGFGTAVGFPSLAHLLELDGFDVDLRDVVHGEHRLVLPGPLPLAAEATATCRAVEVVDRRAAAAVTLEITTVLAGTGAVVTNLLTAVVRGAGGVGERRSVLDRLPSAPRRDPDVVSEVPTLPQQALLHRLSGDDNPLHSDPATAAAAGFDQPILHGLCTLGMAAKAAVRGLLGDDVAAVRGIAGRFAGPVVPGQVLTHRLWAEEGGVAVEVSGPGGDVVLKQGWVRTAPDGTV